MNTVTFTVPEAHKYEQNKTTTDTDYEHTNMSRRCRNNLKSPKFIKILKVIHWGLYFYSCVVKDCFIVQL